MTALAVVFDGAVLLVCIAGLTVLAALAASGHRTGLDRVRRDRRRDRIGGRY